MKILLPCTFPYLSDNSYFHGPITTFGETSFCDIYQDLQHEKVVVPDFTLHGQVVHAFSLDNVSQQKDLP
jgi:hypothetical protein